MQKRGIFIYIFLISCGIINAQELSHQVLVPLALVRDQGEINISQTGGEAMVEFIHCTRYDLTQGFQQPRVKIVDPIPPMGNGVKVFPNPVRQDLTIEMFGETSAEYDVTIFGIEGSVFYRNSYACEGNFWHTITIDVSKYQRGLYFVRVESKDSHISRLFKIEKM